MTQHHIKIAHPNGSLETYCGKVGYRDIGGGMTIAGKWSMSTTSKKPNMDSCTFCVKALPAASKPPTIYTALKEKLGREPTNRELIDRCMAEDAAIAARIFAKAINARKREAESKNRRLAAAHAEQKEAAGLPVDRAQLARVGVKLKTKRRAKK